MVKPAQPAPVRANADSRPRIWFRLRGDQPEFTGHPAGQWRAATDIIDAIDSVGGENAHQRGAVIIWEGVTTHG